jgi:fumarylacetoacetate (FAA) hydrolase family protein
MQMPEAATRVAHADPLGKGALLAARRPVSWTAKSELVVVLDTFAAVLGRELGRDIEVTGRKRKRPCRTRP